MSERCLRNAIVLALVCWAVITAIFMEFVL